MQAPLVFVRGGYVYPGYILDYAGGYGGVGYYWSSVGRSSSDAYHLYFGPYGVYPSYLSDRYLGFSVRCVALGG